MKFKQTFGGQTYLTIELNSQPVGWVLLTVDEKWTYSLRTVHQIDAPTFNSEHKAKLELMKCIALGE